MGFDGNLLPYFKTIAYGILIIFMLPIGILLIHEVSISMFDKYINVTFYPESLFKGLYNPKKYNKKQ